MSQCSSTARYLQPGCSSGSRAESIFWVFEDRDGMEGIERSQSPGRVQLVSEDEGMPQLMRTSLEREIRISCICNGKAGNAMFGLS